MDVIAKEDFFLVDGVPVLNSFFAIEKKGTATSGDAVITRLIFNMIPSKSYFDLQEDDLGTLSPSTSWVSIVLQAGNMLLREAMATQ